MQSDLSYHHFVEVKHGEHHFNHSQQRDKTRDT